MFKWFSASLCIINNSLNTVYIFLNLNKYQGKRTVGFSWDKWFGSIFIHITLALKTWPCIKDFLQAGLFEIERQNFNNNERKGGKKERKKNRKGKE